MSKYTVLNDLGDVVMWVNKNIEIGTKLLQKQRKFNKRMGWFAAIIGIYLVDTRQKCIKQKEEIHKLTKELEELKATKGE